jgi:hypothetical protein
LSEVGVVRSGDQKEIQQTVGTITSNWAATGIVVAVESCGGEVERIGYLPLDSGLLLSRLVWGFRKGMGAKLVRALLSEPD